MKDHVEKYLNESKPKEEKQQQTVGKSEIIQKFFKRYINFLGEGKQVTKDSPQKDIKMLQIIFKIVEKPDININGVLDEKTKLALLKYQKENRLGRTGYFDLETIESLTHKLFPQLNISNLKKTETNDINVVGEKVSQEKLLKDLVNKGLKENTAKGLVANAYGESGFNIKAKGDSGSIAAKSSKAIQIGDKKYCSFGLWQYNVCGGAGINFLKKNRSSTDSNNIEEKLKILFDYEKQLDFMVQTIKPEDNKGDKDVLTWVDWIVDNIERPSDKSGAKRKRGDFAKNQGWA